MKRTLTTILTLFSLAACDPQSAEPYRGGDAPPAEDLDSGSCLFEAEAHSFECVEACGDEEPSAFAWQACSRSCEAQRHADRSSCFASAGNLTAADGSACEQGAWELSSECYGDPPPVCEESEVQELCASQSECPEAFAYCEILRVVHHGLECSP